MAALERPWWEESLLAPEPEPLPLFDPSPEPLEPSEPFEPLEPPELVEPEACDPAAEYVTVEELPVKTTLRLVPAEGLLPALATAFCVGTGIACPLESVRVYRTVEPSRTVAVGNRESEPEPDGEFPEALVKDDDWICP